MKKQLPYFLLVFLLPLLVVAWWWGAFNSATVEVTSRDALHYAYLISEGDYSKVEEYQNDVLALLKSQGIAGGQDITLIEDDPRTTPATKRHARAGVVIPQDAVPRSPLLDGTLPARKSVVVSARAHPFLAYGKAYGALLDYLGEHEMQLRLPVAETTHDSTLTIEMMLE